MTTEPQTTAAGKVTNNILDIISIIILFSALLAGIMCVFYALYKFEFYRYIVISIILITLSMYRLTRGKP